MLRAWWTDDADEPRRVRDDLHRTLGVEVEFWPRETLRETLVTQRYYDALYYPAQLPLSSAELRARRRRQ